MIELPEADNELLQGVCELHVHASPDLSQRPFTELDLARQMRDAGYRAVLFKSHHAMNADRAQIISKVVPGILVFGGIVLNYPVGGINPLAVETAIGFGAKEVWMPTLHAANHIERVGVAGYPKHRLVESARRPGSKVEGISVLDSSGEVIPQVKEVLTLVAEANVVLGTCHLSLEEDMVLVKAAREIGVRKILITHPGWEATDWPLDSLAQLVDMGARLEYCYNSCMPYGNRLDPKRVVEGIRQVGAENCVMATDFGQPYNPHPIDGMRQFMKVLEALGTTRVEIDMMAKRNPAKLLDLE
jgi:hypothetical protein